MDNIVCVLSTAFVIFTITPQTCMACSAVSHTVTVRTSSDPRNFAGNLQKQQPCCSELLEAAQQAEADIVNDKITFNFPQTSGPQNIVIQFTVGETAAFPCTSEAQSGDTAMDYIWKHNNKLIHTDSNHGSFRYTVNNVDNTNFLYIHNIAFHDAGTIECFKRCSNGTNGFCFKKDYTLRPKTRTLHDVFVAPLKDVSVPRSTTARFTCATRLRCVPDSDQYFIWKYGGAFYSVPLGHTLEPIRQLLTRNGLDMGIMTNISKPNDDIAYCEETLTVTIGLPDLSGGRVECWVRSDIYSQEWFVQKAHLHLQ